MKMENEALIKVIAERHTTSHSLPWTRWNNFILYKLIFVKLENTLWHNHTVLSQLHVFTSTPCTLHPLTINDFINFISVSPYPFAYTTCFVRDWKFYKTFKSRPLEFRDELDRTAIVHSHVQIYLKYYNDTPQGTSFPWYELHLCINHHHKAVRF